MTTTLVSDIDRIMLGILIEPGRFCNRVIRNTCVSIAAEKYNLSATYIDCDKCLALGVPLFVTGKNKYNTTVEFNDDSFSEIIENDIPDLNVNLDGRKCFFQFEKSIKILYKYLRSEKVMKCVIDKNPYRDFYNKNNNCYVHVRLGDVPFHNPGFDYYDKVISSLNFDNLFISSDSIDHEICKKIIKKYGGIIIREDEVKTIHFASTCRYIVLSNGSFSSVIGYLAYFSEKIFYPKIKTVWHGELFCIPEWICVDYDKPDKIDL